MLGRTVTETARTKSWDYSTVYDSRTSQDGRKRLCKKDEKDQRITRIQLAPKGEECIDGIRRVLTEMEEIIYQGISREEVLLMKRLLTEMKNNLLESKDFKGVDMQTIMEKTHPSMKHMQELF